MPAMHLGGADNSRVSHDTKVSNPTQRMRPTLDHRVVMTRTLLELLGVVSVKGSISSDMKRSSSENRVPPMSAHPDFKRELENEEKQAN